MTELDAMHKPFTKYVRNVVIKGTKVYSCVQGNLGNTQEV